MNFKMKFKKIGKWLILPFKWLRSLIELLGERPILTGLLLLVLAVCFVSGISIKRGHNYSTDKKFIDSIVIEAHGLVFDIFVFGVLIVIFTKVGEKRQDIKRWKEEIEDFRDWESDEAKFRIVGNIKRLNRKGFTAINLWGCYLARAKIPDLNLQGAILQWANLQGAILRYANLQGAILQWANLQGAYLNDTKSRGTNFYYANLQEVNFQNTYLYNVDLKETKNLTIEQLSQVKTLYKAKLDPDLEKQVKEKYPHLLEPPKEEK